MWMGLSENIVPLNPQRLDIILSTKLLFLEGIHHSDRPMWIYIWFVIYKVVPQFVS